MCPEVFKVRLGLMASGVMINFTALMLVGGLLMLCTVIFLLQTISQLIGLVVIGLGALVTSDWSEYMLAKFSLVMVLIYVV